jgi:hypothetical protein
LALTSCGRFGFPALDDARVAEDGRGGDGGGGSATCNAIARVADDFEDGVQNRVLWGPFAAPGTSLAEVGGDLVLTLAPNAAGAYVGYTSIRYYDLRGSRFAAEIAQVGAAGTTAGLTAIFDGANNLELIARDGMLRAMQLLAGASTELGAIPYDPDLHRYWAIEEVQGRIAFATSMDGVAFASFAEVAAPFDVSVVQARVLGGTDLAIATPGQVRVAAVHAGVAAGNACPATTLVDRFDDGQAGRDWLRSFTDACCGQSESGGLLRFTTDGSVGTLSRASSSGFDLRDSQVQVAVPMLPASSGLAVSLTATRGPFDALVLELRGGLVTPVVVVGGMRSGAGTSHDPADRYLRLREAAGTLYFEVSPDKAAWKIVRQLADPFPLDDVMPSLQGSVFVGTVADQVTFDDFNVP